jgi:hypothetical protein
MYPVVYLNCDLEKRYSKYTFFSRIRDNLNTRLIGESFIKELGLNIAQVKLPPNFNKRAYMKNVESSLRFVSGDKAILSPKTLRLYDYKVLNNFQRELIAYGVVKSIQLILRARNKSIKNGCVLFYDPLNDISVKVLHELAKYASYVILLSKDIGKLTKVSDYIVANYGVTPVVTNDTEYAIASADFIITSRDVNTKRKVPTWFIDNDFIPCNDNTLGMNDVSFKVPWETELERMPPELLGAILGQMDERDIDKSLRYNGIYLDEIKFNDKILEL